MQIKKNTLDRQAIQSLFANIDNQFKIQLLSTNCFPLQYIPTYEELTSILNTFEKSNFSKKGAWTPCQEKLLNVVVFGVCLQNRILPHDLMIQDWERISRLIIHHNWKACRNRWLQEKQAKASWTLEEDQALIQLYNQHPNKWCDIAIELMKKCQTPYARQGKQCRDRWVNKLDPNIKKDPWTKEEELMLFQEVKKKGKRWAEISLQIFQLRRTENTIKNRYYNLIKQEQNKLKLTKMSNEEKEYFVMNKIIKELQERVYQNQHNCHDDTNWKQIMSSNFKISQFSQQLCNIECLIMIKGRKLVKLNETL
ncbi:unnamed protein product [Paramecium primaurelia]|uniref:Uncharacterized protein n=1 Tax=Paramecium primaurelia TaxID=5886 RepID=A0A8S1L4H6_PARPR|nr:unnamed protein product [Paramecium primaurelia]